MLILLPVFDSWVKAEDVIGVYCHPKEAGNQPFFGPMPARVTVNLRDPEMKKLVRIFDTDEEAANAARLVGKAVNEAMEESC